MKEYPIIFQTEMVRAILEGRKSQTRRTQKLEWLTSDHFGIPICDWGLSKYISCVDGLLKFEIQETVDDSKTYEIKCPYGKPGDRLWVRETYLQSKQTDEYGALYYKADHAEKPEHLIGRNQQGLLYYPWKPPRFMPKKYARIWLEITNIRVERLQDISSKDVESEGLNIDGVFEPWTLYQYLWDSINGKKHPWQSNPWVWVIEFSGTLEAQKRHD